MAKEKFERTKPHVNVQSVRLQQIGISSIGARQALQGQPITDAGDRARVAEVLSAVVANNTSLDQLDMSGVMSGRANPT